MNLKEYRHLLKGILVCKEIKYIIFHFSKDQLSQGTLQA